MVFQENRAKETDKERERERERERKRKRKRGGPEPRVLRKQSDQKHLYLFECLIQLGDQTRNTLSPYTVVTAPLLSSSPIKG